MAEFVSEKEALDNLVRHGMLRRDIADIIRKVARDKVAPIADPEGANSRVLALLIDKSGSMAPLKQAVIDGQKHLINSLLGASSTMMIYLGQILFNHKTEHLQPVLPFRSSGHKATDGTKLLTESNYILGGQTALYDTILTGIAMLSTFLDKAESLGQQPFAHVAVITDGVDYVTERDDGPNIGSETRPDSLKQVIDYVLTEGIIHRITFVGIGKYDYGAVARSIGINDAIQIDADPKKIREIFDMISSQTVGGRKQ